MHLARPDDTIVIVPGVYDRDFDKRVVTARAAGVNVAVAGSEMN